MRSATATRRPHREDHRSARSSWIRAAVLGSGDAIISTSSLMIGIAATAATRQSVLVAGVAGLFAGAMSMAVGEYVSVSSQRDAETADIARETQELAEGPQAELRELVQIYKQRGLDDDLAQRVAEQLTQHDPLGAHLRDELGIDHASLSRPFQAAWISALSFATFAILPIIGLLVAPAVARIPIIASLSLASLFGLGALGAHLGGAPVWRAAVRVTLGGAVAMAVTAGVGHLFGVAVN